MNPTKGEDFLFEIDAHNEKVKKKRRDAFKPAFKTTQEKEEFKKKLKRRKVDNLTAEITTPDGCKVIRKMIVGVARNEREAIKQIEELWTEIQRLKKEGKPPEEISAGLEEVVSKLNLSAKQINQSRQQVIDVLNKDTIEIDLDTIELIYGIEREQDGYVSFCRKFNDEHQDLAGIKISELRQWFPQIQRWLLKDAYFSVNAAYRAAPYINSLTGLPSPWRKEIHLRYLNACYCDIDCYKGNLKWSEGVQLVLQAQDDNIIPPASIIGRSGRGVYLLWLLTSERLGAQQRASPQEIELYKQINKAIIRNLDKYKPDLSIDKQAFDASRLLRIPGSMNTKAEEPVVFMVQVVRGGKVPVYTLAQLAEKLEIPVVLTLPAPSKTYLRAITNRGSAPGRRQGKIATGNYRLSDVLTIAQNQGGFKQGRRWKSLSYFCYFAKAAGYAFSDIQKQAGELAKNCQPSYPSETNDTPIAEVVKHIWVRYTPRFNNDYLARFFDVTPELAEELALHSIIPASIASKRAKELPPQTKTRTARRKIIKRIIHQRPGNIPSLRKLKARLEHEGLNTNIETIRKDLKTVLFEIKTVKKPLPYD